MRIEETRQRDRVVDRRIVLDTGRKIYQKVFYHRVLSRMLGLRFCRRLDDLTMGNGSFAEISRHRQPISPDTFRRRRRKP
jgi:hypothetical protein